MKIQFNWIVYIILVIGLALILLPIIFPLNLYVGAVGVILLMIGIILLILTELK